jgi:hypothetical protein
MDEPSAAETTSGKASCAGRGSASVGGGAVTALLVTLPVMPVLYPLVHGLRLLRREAPAPGATAGGGGW